MKKRDLQISKQRKQAVSKYKKTSFSLASDVDVEEFIFNAEFKINKFRVQQIFIFFSFMNLLLILLKLNGNYVFQMRRSGVNFIRLIKKRLFYKISQCLKAAKHILNE